MCSLWLNYETAINASKPQPTIETAGLPLDIDKVQGRFSQQRLGHYIHYFAELDSTNSYARGLAEQGSAEGEIVIAETQTRGRGRLGRTWISPPHLNLYLSVILRPRLLAAAAPQIVIMAAVALADAVASFSALPPAIKWPNDILVGGKKVAGILSESACGSERIEFVILGIGINVNYPIELMPPALRESATSLFEINQAVVEREAFLERLIQGLDRCYGELEESGFNAIARRWEARFSLRGKKVKVEMVDQILVGTATGVDQDGALIVVDERGRPQRIVAGDVTPIEDPE